MKRFTLAALSLLAGGLMTDAASVYAQQPALFQDTVASETPVTDTLDARLKALEQEIQILKARPVPEIKPAPIPDPLGMTGKWNNGLEFGSNNKAIKVHVGGRTQIDTVFWGNSHSMDNTGGITSQDAVNFRRARLRIDGTMYEIIDFAFEYDFANQFNVNPGTPATEANNAAVPAITDAWVNFKEVPMLGNIKVGNFKDPLGMEHLTSSRYLEFMERSVIQDLYTGAFNNGFTPGIMAWDTYDEEHGTWATGFFKNNTTIFGSGVGDGEYNWTSRLTYLPLYEDNGDYLIHMGVSGSIREPNNDAIRFRARPSLRNGPPSGLNPIFLDTGTFGSNQQDLLGAELAGNFGAFSFQTELMNSWTQNTIPSVGPLAGLNVGTGYSNSWYCEGLYFLTGETRPYDRKAGVFTRVVPKENFKWGKGLGAWQLGARYSRTDLRSTGIDGGQLQDVTLGLNWFLNPNMKIQTNYVWADGTGPAAGFGPTRGLNGTAHGIGTRLAIDF